MTPAPKPPAQWPAHRRDPSPGQGRHRAVTPRRTRLRVRPAALAAAACLAAGMALMPYTLASPTGSLAEEPVFPWLSLPVAAAGEPPVETSAVVEVAEETVTEPEPTVAPTTTATTTEATTTEATTTEEVPVTTTQVAAPEGAEDTTTAPTTTSAEPAPVTTTVEPTRPPVSCQEQT